MYRLALPFLALSFAMPGCSTPSTVPNNPGPHYSRHINEALRVCNSATLGAITAGIISTPQEAERFRWQCLFDNKATL
jgi:hypothetical protein